MIICRVEELLEYKEKLKELTKEDINYSLLDNKYYSDKWLCLFEKLWEIKPSLRYHCSRALKHPWLTKEEGEAPLNFLDEMHKANQIFDKFKNIQALVFGMAVLRNKYIKKDRSMILNEYKCRIIREEFLDFTPTPTDKKHKLFKELCFSNQLSSDPESGSTNEFDEECLKPSQVVKGLSQPISEKENKSLRPDFIIKFPNRSAQNKVSAFILNENIV